MQTRLFPGLAIAACLLAGSAHAGQDEGAERLLAGDGLPATLACAQEVGEVPGPCTYRVTRAEAGKTTVTVIFPNGFKRGLMFEKGRFLKASVTMSGTGRDIDWQLQDGLHIIRVDDQYYEVPDSVIARD